MSEEQAKVSKRGWVKNAAIIFLAVMLVLTFFSNTFLNASLPEVAVQYSQSGTINAKIRGSGTIAANNSYEVMLTQSRLIDSVMVKVGDTVEVGDVLFLLGDTESPELKQAKIDLDSMQLAYNKDQLSATLEYDYTTQNRGITKKEAELAQAQRDVNDNYVTDAEISAAEKKLKNAEERLASLGESSGAAGDLTALKKKYQAAEEKWRAADSLYAADKQTLREAAITALGATTNPTEKQIESYMLLLAEDGRPDKDSAANYLLILELEAAYETAYATYEAALDADSFSSRLADANADVKKYTDLVAELKEKKTAYAAAQKSVTSLTGELEDLRFELEQQKKKDNIEKQISGLDRASAAKLISQKQQEVADMTKEATGAEVLAKAAGVIKSISVTAGQTAQAQQAMATIENPDQGYSMSISVTTEQAKRVKVGAEAEVSSYYWGPSYTATLTGIKTDPANPMTNKLLEFNVKVAEGETIEGGTTLNITMGEKSADYQVVVPNSALRTDSNGDFVLTIVAKSTPLGNRYIATRVDVKVLAKDDINSAVSGGLTSWDYVITTSTLPLEPGQQVRLKEN